MKNAENLNKTASQLVEELNAMITGADQIDGELFVNKEIDTEKVIKAENTAATRARIDALLDKSREEMFVDLLENPFIPGLVRLKRDKQTGHYELVAAKKQLSFPALEKAYQVKMSKEHNADGSPIPNKNVSLSRDDRYTVMVSLFIDNIARAIAGDIASPAPQLSKAMAARRATEVDFTAATNTAMVKQLNTIVAAILPETMEVKMIAADVKAIKQAATKEKFMEFTMNKETAMMGKIFLAIGIRRAGKAYSFQSAADCHKADK